MNPTVSILMPTYNHEKYITKAIESALMQKTTYKWELLIHDDCSTDGTKQIAKAYAERYPEQIFLIEEKENQGLIKSYKALIDISKGKYLAILESDDYWLNENKLQKQLDFLVANPDYGLVASDIVTVDENDNVIQNGGFNFDKRDSVHWYDKLLGNNGIWGACSCVFSKQDFENYCDIDEYVTYNFKTFDHPTWLSISKNKKCYLFDEKLAAYRISSSSISNTSDGKKKLEFEKGIYKIEKYVTSKFGFCELEKKVWIEKIANSVMGKALKYHQKKYFVEYAKKIQSRNIKQFFMKYFPSLYYYQFVLRHRK